MAIVINKDGQGIIVNGAYGSTDKPFATPNRAGAGVPAGVSLYASEIMLNTTTDETYRAMETGTAIWVKI